MELHKHTLSLVSLINSFLTCCYNEQSLPKQYKCYLFVGKTRRNEDAVYVEMSDFIQTEDHAVWKYNIYFPQDQEICASLQVAAVHLHKILDGFCDEVPGQVKLNANNLSLSIKLVEPIKVGDLYR